MKTATVRELRNNYSKVLQWVAKVVPPIPAKAAKVDWTQSAALTRPAWATQLTAKESAAILADSQGS